SKTSKSIEIEKAISFYQDKSRVNNTEKVTKNWLEHFEKFRKSMIEVYPHDKNYKTELKSISELSILDNQREVIGGAAQKVSIPADSPNFRGPCYDYQTGIWYRKQHISRNSLSGFMKDLVHKTGIEVDGLLTNHSGQKTAALSKLRPHA
ncbi:33458_t:CDS:2, partial [Racocetra persica]